MTDSDHRSQLYGMLVIAAVTTAVFAAAQGAAMGAVTAVIMFGFVAAIHFGRNRSETLQTAGGLGDERIRTLYGRAMTITAGVMSFVLPGWFLVTVAAGDANQTLAQACLVFAVVFFAASAWCTRRG